MTTRRTLLEKFIQDKNGKTVIWQNPNPALILWFISTLLSKLFKQGGLHNFLGIVAFGSIFAWAWMEVFQGASPFRRYLGAIVLVLSVHGRL